jgi:hypothetical protein
MSSSRMPYWIAKFFTRQIQPSIAIVLPHIAQDVGHLQGHAEFDGVLHGVVTLEADNVHAHQPNRGCNSIAICGKVVKGLVTRLGKVAGYAIDQLQGVVARDMVSGEGICPCGGDQVVGRGRGGLNDIAPVVQFKVAIFFGFDFIHNVIHGAAEGIQGADGGAFFFGQQPEAKWKDLLCAAVMTSACL